MKTIVKNLTLNGQTKTVLYYIVLPILYYLYSLPILYWLPKLHNTQIRARFIIASKTCSTKPLSGVISKMFKMLFKHVENFYNKHIFYSSYKKFCVVKNPFQLLKN